MITNFETNVIHLAMNGTNMPTKQSKKAPGKHKRIISTSSLSSQTISAGDFSNELARERRRSSVSHVCRNFKGRASEEADSQA